MEIRVLRYFLAVVREQNISRAAESLHITQPTLSRQIAELEEDLQKMTDKFVKKIDEAVDEKSKEVMTV